MRRGRLAVVAFTRGRNAVPKWHASAMLAARSWNHANMESLLEPVLVCEMMCRWLLHHGLAKMACAANEESC